MRSSISVKRYDCIAFIFRCGFEADFMFSTFLFRYVVIFIFEFHFPSMTGGISAGTGL